jgi:YVTN family beta-propeller protein
MLKSIHIGAIALLLAAPAAAQDYTIVTVSHADNLISEIDPVSGQTRQKFTVMPGEWGGETHEGCVTADGKTAYISIPYAKHVLVLDLETFKPKGKLESPYFTRASTHTQSTSRGGTKESTSTDPHGVALSADESKLYVTVEFGEVPGVVAYDLKTGKSTKIDTVVMGNWLGVHPKTGMIFVPSRSQADNVTVIDTKTEKVIRAIPLKNGSRPAGVAFGGPNGEVWISGDGDGSISLIDSTSLKVVKVLGPRSVDYRHDHARNRRERADQPGRHGRGPRLPALLTRRGEAPRPERKLRRHGDDRYEEYERAAGTER